jgi:phage-related protein
VRCHRPNGNNPFAITGIPPHISILTHMHGLMDRVDQVVPRIERVIPAVVQGLTNVSEERAIGAGTVTTHGLRKMIRNVMGDVLGEAGVPEVL